ncbi:HipA domain-containing protein [Empedobacter falsenii]|uniref:HipA domain-containing protein n=1 Tax=Empedobacter TaxID=59734 RepID=UPI002447DB37|nr:MULTISPECIES: HipA domain-containing protein [unclassified Empedobacter]MDH0659277.1 HipA domain-containing protein [Empedobacter sp. GD03865]MDH0675411.1 HipA domain-containing protein [Empedobacter sp. GD03861]
MIKCLSCYKELAENEIDFHSKCSKKIFGSINPPSIDFDSKQLEELAKELIVKSVAVTGVQPKLSLNLISDINKQSRFTIVDLEGNYILKPASKEYIDLPENEDLTMHLAELVKIKTATHTLIRLKSGELAYLTKRFDRKNQDKIAVEDFCQLTENLTEHKYRGSIEKIGKLIYQLTKNSGFEAQKLFEIVLFNYLTANADMHLKNYSLIENDFNEYELSPAYDLLNTLLLIPDDKEESALTINGKKNRLKIEDFNQLAKTLKIPNKSVESIYKRFIKIRLKWIDFVEISFLNKDTKQAYIETLNTRFNKLFSSNN